MRRDEFPRLISSDSQRSEALENLLQETRRFEPPDDLAANANVTAGAYEQAAADRLGFWAQQARRLTRDGYVREQTLPGARRKRQLQLTAKGRRVVTNWLRQPARAPQLWSLNSKPAAWGVEASSFLAASTSRLPPPGSAGSCSGTSE